MDPELAVLTSTAATTVQLLATAAWEQAKSAVVGLWRRVHPERVEMVQADLEDSRVEVPATLPTFDAIHLASALSVHDELIAFCCYN